MTAGIGAQVGLERVMGGAETLLATRVGNFRGLAGASWSAAAGVDVSGALEYRLAFPSAAKLPALNAAVRYSGRSFLGPLDARDENLYSWQLSGSLSQALPFGFGLNLGAGWRDGWGTTADLTTASLTLTRAGASGTSLALLVTAEFAAGSAPEVRAILTVTAAAPGSRRSAGMAASIDSGSTSVDLHLQPFSDPRAPSVFATMNGLPTEPGGASGTVGALYAGPVVEATLSDTFAPGTNSLSLEAAAALVTAGGALALSRPVADSFAVVVPRQNMADQRVVVNRGAGERQAVAERGRPAALPWLESYAPATITVEAPEAPPGTGGRRAPAHPGAHLQERHRGPGRWTGHDLRGGIPALRGGKGGRLEVGRGAARGRCGCPADRRLHRRKRHVPGLRARAGHLGDPLPGQ